VTWWFPFGGGLLLLGAVVLALTAVRRRIWPDGGGPTALLATLGATAVAGLVATASWRAGSPAAVTDRLWVIVVVVLLPVAIVLYPDGRPPAGLGWAAVALIAATGGLGVAYPGSFAASGLLGLVDYLLILAIHWWRFEHSEAAGRRALQWLALGALPGSLVAGTAVFILSPPAAAVVDLIVWAVFLAGLVVGLAAPEIRDIRRLTLSVSAHAITVLMVVSVFAAVLAGLDTIAGHRVTLAPGSLGLIAAACALGYAPFARLFRQIIEILLFGVRHDPIRAASRAGDQLGEDPGPALRSLRESLALPYAALVDGSGQVVAATGQVAGVVVHRPLSATDPGLGRLEVGLRAGQSHLLRGDQQVLAVLAPALGQLMHARRLGADLKASRAAMVEGIEEERRRLRRDLHDGLGPRLTGVAYAADAARNVLSRDPERAATLLTGVRAEAGEAIVEVRRLVEGLRPPSLDQVGLEQALRQHARHLLRPDGRPLVVEVCVPAPLPPLGAAVEVTAYRIVVEALTNTARHAAGEHAVVTLRLDGDALAVEIRDRDGNDEGAGEPWPPGVGLTSMRERTEMLGGSLTAGAGRVVATLPLGPAHAEGAPA
jgi:two-component system NarL family sensor kinase